MARAFAAASSQYLEASTPVTAPPFTVAAWFRTPSSPATGAVLAIGDSSGSDRYQIQISLSPNIIRWGVVAGAASASVDTTTNWTAATWHHVCAVESSTSNRAIYLDGAGKGTDTTTISPSNEDKLTVGTRYSGGTRGFYFSGDIAEVAVWNVALTDAEVSLLAMGIRPHQVRRADIIAYWPLYGDDSPEPDMIGSADLTVNGATKATHLSMKDLMEWVIDPAREWAMLATAVIPAASLDASLLAGAMRSAARAPAATLTWGAAFTAGPMRAAALMPVAELRSLIPFLAGVMRSAARTPAAALQWSASLAAGVLRTTARMPAAALSARASLAAGVLRTTARMPAAALSARVPFLAGVMRAAARLLAATISKRRVQSAGVATREVLAVERDLLAPEPSVLPVERDVQL